MPRIVQLCVILWARITRVPCQIDWPRRKNEIVLRAFDRFVVIPLIELGNRRMPRRDVAWVLLDRRTWVHVGTDRVKEYVVDRVPVSRWLKRYKDGCELYLLLGLRGLWIHWRSSRSGSWKSLRKRDMGSDWKFLFFRWSISILEILHFNYLFVNMY